MEPRVFSMGPCIAFVLASLHPSEGSPRKTVISLVEYILTAYQINDARDLPRCIRETARYARRTRSLMETLITRRTATSSPLCSRENIYLTWHLLRVGELFLSEIFSKATKNQIIILRPEKTLQAPPLGVFISDMVCHPSKCLLVPKSFPVCFGCVGLLKPTHPHILPISFSLFSSKFKNEKKEVVVFNGIPFFIYH